MKLQKVSLRFEFIWQGNKTSIYRVYLGYKGGHLIRIWFLRLVCGLGMGIIWLLSGKSSHGKESLFLRILNIVPGNVVSLQVKQDV